MSRSRLSVSGILTYLYFKNDYYPDDATPAGNPSGIPDTVYPFRAEEADLTLYFWYLQRLTFIHG